MLATQAEDERRYEDALFNLTELVQFNLETKGTKDWFTCDSMTHLAYCMRTMVRRHPDMDKREKVRVLRRSARIAQEAMGVAMACGNKAGVNIYAGLYGLPRAAATDEWFIKHLWAPFSTLMLVIQELLLLGVRTVPAEYLICEQIARVKNAFSGDSNEMLLLRVVLTNIVALSKAGPVTSADSGEHVPAV